MYFELVLEVLLIVLVFLFFQIHLRVFCIDGLMIELVGVVVELDFLVARLIVPGIREHDLKVVAEIFV